MSNDQKPERLCANCNHFMMDRGWGWGRCGLRFPPWMLVEERHGDRGTRSDDTCSFHESRDG